MRSTTSSIDRPSCSSAARNRGRTPSRPLRPGDARRPGRQRSASRRSPCPSPPPAPTSGRSSSTRRGPRPIGSVVRAQADVDKARHRFEQAEEALAAARDADAKAAAGFAARAPASPTDSSRRGRRRSVPSRVWPAPASRRECPRRPGRRRGGPDPGRGEANGAAGGPGRRAARGRRGQGQRIGIVDRGGAHGLDRPAGAGYRRRQPQPPPGPARHRPRQRTLDGLLVAATVRDDAPFKDAAPRPRRAGRGSGPAGRGREATGQGRGPRQEPADHRLHAASARIPQGQDDLPRHPEQRPVFEGQHGPTARPGPMDRRPPQSPGGPRRGQPRLGPAFRRAPRRLDVRLRTPARPPRARRRCSTGWPSS